MAREKIDLVAVSEKGWRLWVYWLAELASDQLIGSVGKKILSLSEIVAVSAVYFWVVWRVAVMVPVYGLGLGPFLVILATATYVVYISPFCIHRDSLSTRGLGPFHWLFGITDNFFQALRGFGLWTFVGVAVLLFAGSSLKSGPLNDFDQHTFMLRLAIYFLSALGQDALFFGFFLWRWQALFEGMTWPRRPAGGRGGVLAGWLAIAANALLFSLYHLPNVPVMAMTLVMGVIWGMLFSRTPNLMLSALGHALLGTTLNVVLQMNLKIGSAYYWGHKGFYRAVFPFFEPIIGGRF